MWICYQSSWERVSGFLDSDRRQIIYRKHHAPAWLLHEGINWDITLYNIPIKDASSSSKFNSTQWVQNKEKAFKHQFCMIFHNFKNFIFSFLSEICGSLIIEFVFQKFNYFFSAFLIICHFYYQRKPHKSMIQFVTFATLKLKTILIIKKNMKNLLKVSLPIYSLPFFAFAVPTFLLWFFPLFQFFFFSFACSNSKSYF